MTLVVQWWFFVPFGTRGRVLYSLSGNHPQCPFIQLTDTEVTFLSCYNTGGHTRVYVMALTSPPSLPLSRLWAELSVRRFLSSPLLIQGSSLLSVLPYSLSVFWKFKNLTLSVTTFPPSLGSCPDAQVKALASFPSSSYYLLFRVCQTLSFFFPFLFLFPQEFARLLVLTIHLASLKLEFARL